MISFPAGGPGDFFGRASTKANGTGRRKWQREATIAHVVVAATEDLFERAQHPYTQELLRLMPRLDGIAETAAVVAS